MVATAERGTAQAIREEAAKLFFERGYDATSLRQVASAVGLMVGSLYNHINLKPMNREEALIMEEKLAWHLRKQGYAVWFN